jgi:hypothetical protein
MSPPQAIKVAREAFAPDGSHLAWHQPIQPTTREDIAHMEEGLSLSMDHRWAQNLDSNCSLPCPAHPAARSSSVCSVRSTSEVVTPVESRPGARFPGFRLPDVVEGCA